MASGAFTGRTVFGRVPFDIPEVTNFCARRDHHQNPFVNGVDQDYTLAFLVLFNRLANPSGRTLLFALVHNGSEWDVGVSGLAPFAGQPIEVVGFGIRASIEVEVELHLKRTEKLRRRQPIMLAVVPVPLVELVILWPHPLLPKLRLARCHKPCWTRAWR